MKSGLRATRFGSRCHKLRNYHGYMQIGVDRPPNRRLQLTALRAREIMAFLKAGISSAAISIYWCAAAEARGVRLLGNVVGKPF
jgi:hypothetical protein